MKVTYFVNEYPKVSHSFIRREILALERRGMEVRRIALRGWNGPLPDEEDRREREQTAYVLRRGIKALLWPTLRQLIVSPRRFWNAIGLAVKMSRDSDRPLPYHLVYVAEACCTLSWLAASGAEHVHAHFGTNSAEVVMLVRALGGPTYSFTVHGPDEFMRPMNLAEKIGHSSFVVAISSFGRSQLYLRSQHADWEKIKVVRCGLEQDFYQAGVVAPVVSSRRLVCVGRLCEAKGQLLLIDATARLAARGILFQLVLAGDGPMRPALEAMIRERGLESQVRITGWISSGAVREEILAAQALVLPSFAEGLPVVIMEAMALRRPVLTTFVAGIPELVCDGENGWLFPAGSAEELARAIESCLASDAEKLQSLGEAGYARVVAMHSIDIEAGKLAELFDSARRQPDQAATA